MARTYEAGREKYLRGFWIVEPGSIQLAYQ